jgi:hypothetical protein
MLMVAVAVVGLLIGGFLYSKRLRERAWKYRQIAAEHNALARRAYRPMLAGFKLEQDRARAKAATTGSQRDARRVRIWDEPIQFTRESMDYHEFLRAKYEYAASHPWQSVPPDPPDPNPQPKSED